MRNPLYVHRVMLMPFFPCCGNGSRCWVLHPSLQRTHLSFAYQPLPGINGDWNRSWKGFSPKILFNFALVVGWGLGKYWGGKWMKKDANLERLVAETWRKTRPPLHQGWTNHLSFHFPLYHLPTVVSSPTYGSKCHLATWLGAHISLLYTPKGEESDSIRTCKDKCLT